MLAGVRDRVDSFQKRHASTAFTFGVLKKFGEDKAGGQAALLAYYGFFSLFPLLLAFVTILAIVLRDNPELQDRVLRSALSQFPIIGDQIRENVQAISRSGLALAIGLVGALWAGMGGIKAMQSALDHVWDVPLRAQPGLPKRLLRGAIMLAVLGAFAFISTGLTGVGTEGESVSLVARIFTFPISLVVNIFVFMLAFKVLTAADVTWRTVAPGAIAAGLVWTGLQAAGNYYVANKLKDASEMYGFFGIVMGLLSWLYLGAQMTLLAAEINVVKAKRLWPRSLGPEPQTEADKRALEAHARVEERVASERVNVSFDGDDSRRAAS